MAFDEQINRLTGVQPQPFNSCNAWGFGGGVGHVWKSERVIVKVFKAYYRHLPATKNITIREILSADGRNRLVFDEIRTANTERQAVQILQKLCVPVLTQPSV